MTVQQLISLLQLFPPDAVVTTASSTTALSPEHFQLTQHTLSESGFQEARIVWATGTVKIVRALGAALTPGSSITPDAPSTLPAKGHEVFPCRYGWLCRHCGQPRESLNHIPVERCLQEHDCEMPSQHHPFEAVGDAPPRAPAASEAHCYKCGYAQSAHGGLSNFACKDFKACKYPTDPAPGHQQPCEPAVKE